VPVGMIAVRRRRILPALAACIVLIAGGCGAGRLIPSASGPGSGAGAVTPAGTYNIVVTATSTGLTRTVNLSLVVQ
jgi:hypothetical protein